MCGSTADDLKRVLDKPSRDPKDHPARIPENAEPHPMSRLPARHAAASRACHPNRAAVLIMPARRTWPFPPAYGTRPSSRAGALERDTAVQGSEDRAPRSQGPQRSTPAARGRGKASGSRR